MNLENLTDKIFIIACLIVVSFCVERGLLFVKNRYFKRIIKSNLNIEQRRIDTLALIFKNVITYGILSICIFLILSTLFGKEILGIISVIGIALGVACQNIIKDIINGGLLVLEGQFNIGDYIVINNLEGNIESIGIRKLTLRSFTGEQHIIPNGNISLITNKSKFDTRATIDIPIKNTESIEKAYSLIESSLREVNTDSNIIEELKILGILEINEFCTKIRIVGKTFPQTQWEIERKTRLIIKKRFEKNNINF